MPLENAVRERFLRWFSALGAVKGVYARFKRSMDPNYFGPNLPRPTPIAALEHQRFAMIQGVVRAVGSPIPAPLTGRECVAYKAGYSKLRDSHEEGGGWLDGVEEVRGVSLLVNDGTGIALVDWQVTKPVLVPYISNVGESCPDETKRQFISSCRKDKNKGGPGGWYEGVFLENERVGVIASFSLVTERSGHPYRGQQIRAKAVRRRWKRVLVVHDGIVDTRFLPEIR